METAGVEPALPRCKRGAAAAARPRERCGRVESNHHSLRRPGYSRLGSPCPASARVSGRAAPLPLDPCLDHHVTCLERRGHAVTAVAHDEAAAVAGEAHRRRLAALLEPLAVAV